MLRNANNDSCVNSCLCLIFDRIVCIMRSILIESPIPSPIRCMAIHWFTWWLTHLHTHTHTYTFNTLQRNAIYPNNKQLMLGKEAYTDDNCIMYYA